MDTRYNVKMRINESYGIFVSDKKQKVELRFDKKIKEIVENLVWTPDQEMTNIDGNITVKFFIADYREIKNDILSYGENIEVIYPEGLRDAVKRSIENMHSLYTL